MAPNLPAGGMENDRIKTMMKMLSMLLCCLALGMSLANAQTYPDRPIKLVLPYAPGGIIDTAGRLLGKALEAQLKQPVVPDNRPGAGGMLGTAVVAQSQPDGYTILFIDPAIAINPSLQKSVPYNLFKDLKVVATVSTSPLIVAVPPSVPVYDLKQLIAYSKAKDGGVAFASAGVGTTTHLAPELLKLQAGLVGTHVPYRGAGPSMPDLLSERVQVVFYSPAAVQPFIDDNRVRAIAQTGSTRSQSNPNVPTGIESGFPDFRVDLWTAVFVPSATPQPVVDRLAREIQTTVNDPGFRAAMAKIGAEPFYQGPAEAAAFVRKDFDKWADLIRSAKIELN
jgi:tripartite-type tricarboxylate transporter receptor subunit TctC